MRKTNLTYVSISWISQSLLPHRLASGPIQFDRHLRIKLKLCDIFVLNNCLVADKRVRFCQEYFYMHSSWLYIAHWSFYYLSLSI